MTRMYGPYGYQLNLYMDNFNFGQNPFNNL